MPLPTSRTKQNASIKINTEMCNSCGLCVLVCKSSNLIINNNDKVEVQNSTFGCMGCGHCMAICQAGAIEINGREISNKNIYDLAKTENLNNYENLTLILNKRRSIREFTNQEIDQEIIDKIIAAAQTAPVGYTPSDVNVLIIKSKEKTREFAVDFSNYLKSISYITSNLFLLLMRPFWGKSNDELFKNFIKPLLKTYTNEIENGNNLINYDAPLLMYFYGSPYSSPADPIIAATYAMIAGESLGLGTCMLGAVHPFIQNGKNAKRFREKYKIKFKSRQGLVVIFGYPKAEFTKGIKRTFASIETI